MKRCGNCYHFGVVRANAGQEDIAGNACRMSSMSVNSAMAGCVYWVNSYRPDLPDALSHIERYRDALMQAGVLLMPDGR